LSFTLAEAVVFFKGDDSKLSSDLDNAEGKTKGFASTATNLIGGAVAGAAVAAGAAIIGIGTAAFNVSNDTATAAANMAANLGLPIAEAERFADVAKQVYGNAFADSVGDAADAVTLVAKQMGLAADDPALKTMTENALRLRDSFGIDVSESIGTVKNLMENFGITSEEAFDLIAAGNQKGLNASGDMLESINEYAVQFASGGASASQFFSVMESGYQNGVLGTDKAADAFKEFRVRIQDGSALTADSLEQLGLDSATILAGLENGTLSAADAFGMVTEALANTENSTTQFQAGVGLLGTQFEDLGTDIAANLTMTNDWAAGSAGAIGSLDAKYATFGGAMDSLWRRLVVSVTPFTDKLLELVNSAMPYVIEAFNVFDQNIVPIMDGIGAAVSVMVEFVKPLFAQLTTSVDGVTGPMIYLKEWVDTNLPMLQKVFETVLGAIQGFWNLFGEDIMYVLNNTFVVMSTIIGTALATVGDVITLFLQLVTGDWEGAWETFKGIFERIWETIKTVASTQLDSLKTLFSNIDWGKVGETLINAVLSGIQAAWSGLTSWLTTGLQGMWASITGVDWAGAGKSIVESTKSGAESVWGDFSGWVKTSSEKLLTYWNTTTWEQKGKDSIAAIQKGSEAAYTTYKTSLATFIDGIMSFFTGEDYTGTGEKLITDIETGIANAWNEFLAFLGLKVQDIWQTFENIDWEAAGASVVNGIKAGIENAWGEFVGWFQGKLQEVSALLPFSEPKDSSSPLRNLGKSGAAFVTNWRDGAEREMGNLQGSLAAGFGNLLSGINGAGNGSQPLTAGAGGDTFNVYLSGKDATYENGRAVGRGILDEMRKRGR
jgi:hypothetical protein